MFALQQKLDGLTLVLYYANGELTSAVTRGSGLEGEDIKANAVKMQNVKRTIVGFTGSLRGEIMLSISAFKKYFEPLGFKNPRNTVSGKSRDTEAGDLLKHLKVIFFDVVGCGAKTEDGNMKFLESVGLEHVAHELVDSPERIWQRYQEIEQERPNLDHEIDGVIIKANDLSIQEKLGSDGDLRPRGQRCIKFVPPGAETVLEDIDWSIGHTGQIIPTGKVRPVQIGGVTVSNVLLNNLDEFARLNLQTLGCTVKIIRAGDVIPKVTAVLKQGDRPLNTPEQCPSCKTNLVRSGPALFCRNGECAGQKVRLIRRWLTALDIKFIGPEIEQALWQSGLVKDPADLYRLKEGSVSVETELFDKKTIEMAKLPLGSGILGEDRAKQILAEIEKTRELTLHEFMGALGIQFLGVRAAKHLVEDNGFDTIEKFMDPKLIRTGKGKSGAKVLGPAIREGVAAGVEANLPLIKKLLKVVKIAEAKKEAKPVATGGKLAGRAIVFTGVRPTTAEQEKFESLGGVVRSSVSKNCTHLIVKALGTGSNKAMYAQELGLDVATYDQFKEWLKEG